jgi:peptide/nickel transport system permease protein
MARYVLRRLIWAAFVLLIVTFLTFTIYYVLPLGDPTSRIPPARKVLGGPRPSPERLEEVRRQLGLDRSLPEQYGLFVKRLVLGDGDHCPTGVDGCGWPGLGISYDSRTSVRQEILERAPRTISLTLGAAVIWLVAGISIGVVSALRRRTDPHRPARPRPPSAPPASSPGASTTCATPTRPGASPLASRCSPSRGGWGRRSR